MSHGEPNGHLNDDKGQGQHVWAHYLENGWRFKLGHNGAHAGNVK